MKPKSTLRHFLALAGSALITISFASSATLTWDSAIDSNWDTTDANWTSNIWDNAVPDDAIFGATGVGTITLTEAITAGSLTFNTAGYIIDTATFGLTLNSGITANENATIQSGSGGSIILGADNTWSVAATKALAVSSNISGTGFGIDKTGDGTLTLSGTNTYDGVTTVSAGTLLATKAAALSGYNVANRVSVASGATLTVNAGTGAWSAAEITGLLSASPFAFASGSNLGIVNTADFALGALRGGSYTIIKQGAGTMTLGSIADSSFTGSTIDVTAGNLSINVVGALSSVATTPNTTTVNVGAAGILTAGGNIDSVFRSSGTGNPHQLINLNGGRVELRKFATGNYGGDFVTTGGTIAQYSNGSKTQTYTMNSLRINSGTTTIYLDPGSNNNSHNINFASGTTVAGNATLETSKPVGKTAFALNLGPLAIGNHTLTTQGESAITAGATTLSGAATFSAGGSGLLTLGAVTGGVHNFTKSGVGVLNLSAAGSGSGTYTVNGGVLRLSNATSLPGGINATGGTSALTLNGGALELGNGNFTRNLGAGVTQFQITGGESGFSAFNGARTVTVNNSAATVVQWGSATFAPSTFVLNAATANNTLLFTNRLDLNGDGVATTRNIAVMANTATLSGIIENLGGSAIGLTKSGAGTLVLSNAGNTYDGSTTVSGGTLTLGASGALPSGSNVDLAGGTLNSGTATNVAGTLTLSADSTIALGGGSLSFASAVGNWTTQDVNLSLTGALGPATNILRFGTDATGLTADQLARVTYNGLASGVAQSVTLDASGYIRSASTDGTWTGGSGNWSNTGIWANGIIAEGVDATMNTGGVVNKTITLDSDRTVGYITSNRLSNTLTTHTIDGASTLTLDVSTGTPTLSTSHRRQNLVISARLAGNDGLEIPGGTGADTAGGFTLSGDNTYTGGTILTSGTVQVGHVNALSSGTITFNGGHLQSSGTTDYTFANTIAVTGNVFLGRNAENNFTDSTGDLTFSNTAATALGATRTFTVNSAAVKATFAQAFSGTANINKAGAGTLVLSGASTYNGLVNITGGKLEVNTIGNVLGGASPFGNSTGATVNRPLGSGTTTTGSIWFTGAGATLVYTGTGETTNRPLGAVNVGNWSIDQSGSGLLKFTGSLTLNYPTSANYPLTLQGSTDGTGEFAGNMNDSSAGRLHRVIKAGTGTWTLSGTNGYTGGTTVNEGTLLTTKAAALPGYNLASRVSVANNATLGVNVDAGGWDSGQIDSLLGATTAAFAAGSKLGIDITTGSFTYANDIGTTQTAKGLVKSGAGTLTLSGTNTYTGATTIDAGKLVVGVGGVGSITSNVTVNDGGTLGGSGTIAGTLTVNDGGTHNAGNSPGLQTIDGNITYNSGSIFEWDLAANKETNTPGVRGTDYDAVDITGSLTVDSEAIFKVIMNEGVNFADTFWESDRVWSNIFNVTGSISGWAADTAVAIYDTSNVLITPVSGSFTISGTTLNWSGGFAAIPEPTSALAGLLLGAGLLRRRRK